MSKPWIHALSSSRKYGGKPEDYIEIHNLMDSSKSCMGDNRHRTTRFTGQCLDQILNLRVFLTRGMNMKFSGLGVFPNDQSRHQRIHRATDLYRISTEH